jgi:hypothetical protein
MIWGNISLPLIPIKKFVIYVIEEDEEEDVKNCWMTLGTEEDTLI